MTGPSYKKILVIQTAFIGDIVLTLPMIQFLKRCIPEAQIDVVVVPRSADLLRNHPAVRTIIHYDKRKSDKGIRGFLRLTRRLRSEHYDLALVPHRSLRSALLACMSGIPIRIGFNTSAGRWCLTQTALYDKHAHEVERNLTLLAPLGMAPAEKVLPDVIPGEFERREVDELFVEWGLKKDVRPIAIAPGTIWNTKRWPMDRYAAVAGNLGARGLSVVLVGGNDDAQLCREVKQAAGSTNVHIAAGKLGLLASAELLRRCRVIVCNDSAPMHMAVAVRTPVAAVFGATIPAFGFAPYGNQDAVIEVEGLSCRPCSIHGGNECPIRTFDCMNGISPERVVKEALRLAGIGQGESV